MLDSKNESPSSVDNKIVLVVFVQQKILFYFILFENFILVQLCKEIKVINSFRLFNAREKRSPWWKKNSVQAENCGRRSLPLEMYSKAIFFLIFSLIFFISCSILVGTVDIRSYFFPLLQSQPISPFPCAADPPLRVYMYDLPRRFNVGILNRRNLDQTPVTASTWPPWPRNSGLKRQHSVEYWMMGSLLHEATGDGRDAVRVMDPENADAFFVPFFSSLSFNSHGRNMTDPATEVDHQLQVPCSLLYSFKFVTLLEFWNSVLVSCLDRGKCSLLDSYRWVWEGFSEWDSITILEFTKCFLPIASLLGFKLILLQFLDCDSFFISIVLGFG